MKKNKERKIKRERKKRKKDANEEAIKEQPDIPSTNSVPLMDARPVGA